MTLLAWQRGGALGGPAVVLIHGWARDGQRDWDATGWVAELAGAGHEVLVCDLPGHGDSADVPVPDRAEPAGWAAEAVEADLPRMGVREAALAGFAEGCMVAGHLAARRPELYRPLVLVGCDDRVGMPGADQVVAGLRGQRAKVWDAEAADTLAFARADRRHDLDALAAWVERASWPAAARLGALRAPVLLAVGADDERRQGAPRLAQLFHDARLVTVPGDRDAALASPELIAQVRAFLEEHA